jgi:hypothetical protein
MDTGIEAWAIVAAEPGSCDAEMPVERKAQPGKSRAQASRRSVSGRQRGGVAPAASVMNRNVIDSSHPLPLR